MKTGYSISLDGDPVARDVLTVIRARHSTRSAFDPVRSIPAPALDDILEAARWAPTAHNMQNFEIVVVDDATILGELGAVEAPVSEVFVRENYKQLSFSRAELQHKRIGILAENFPRSWCQPDVTADTLRALGPSYLRDTMRGAPMVLVVTYDPRMRAPASEGDALGLMSLGCVLQNMWLAAYVHGLGLHVMSTFANGSTADGVKRTLSIPFALNIAFAAAIGYPRGMTSDYLRVRRDVTAFVHRNSYR